MSLSPPSQLLDRNLELFSRGKWLIINPADALFSQKLASYDVTYLYQYFDVFSQVTRIQNALELDSRDIIERDYGFSMSLQVSGQQHTFAPFLTGCAVYSDVLLYLPKSKAQTQMLLQMAAAQLLPSGRLHLVGENKGGIKSVGKLLDTYGPHQKIDSARHCSLLTCTLTKSVESFNPIKWVADLTYELNGTEWLVTSLPGVFSHGELDDGTRLLLEKLPSNLSGDVFDFACGAGVIGSYVLRSHPHVKLCASDVSALAIYCSAHTLNNNNQAATLYAANGLQCWSRKFNQVLTNPPFHTGVKTDYAVTENFIKQIKRMMKTGASLNMVANRFLPYPGLLSEHFSTVHTVAQTNKFSVYLATN